MHDLAPVNDLHLDHREANPLIRLHGGSDTIETSFAQPLPEMSRSRRVIRVRAAGRRPDEHAEATEHERVDTAPENAVLL
ncbi:MAG TPA: hypothetical protein VFN10_13300 [Thermoanaerobaculia bacterium]|nr:hypothetical protein [Thermoanaerobaculia bacterium]